VEHVTLHPSALEELRDVVHQAPADDQWLISSDLRLLQTFGGSYFAMQDVPGEPGLVECWMRRKQTYVIILERLDDVRLCVLSLCCLEVGPTVHAKAIDRARSRRYT
jgi:hypothetical protein